MYPWVMLRLKYKLVWTTTLLFVSAKRLINGGSREQYVRRERTEKKNDVISSISENFKFLSGQRS